MIINLILNIINNSKYKYSIALPIILSNIKLNENVSSVTEVSYAVFVLSLIALLCFINIIFYILSYILLTKGNYMLETLISTFLACGEPSESIKKFVCLFFCFFFVLVEESKIKHP